MFSASNVTFDHPSYYVNPPAIGFQTPKRNAAVWYLKNYEKKDVEVKPDQEDTFGLKAVIASLGRMITGLNMSMARDDMETEFALRIFSYFPVTGAFSGLYHLYQAALKQWEPTENWNEKRWAHIARGSVEVLTLGFAGGVFLILDIFMTIYHGCQSEKRVREAIV